MSQASSSSAALPIAYAALRILIVVTWVVGAAIVVLLVAIPHREWILSSLDLAPSPEADRVIRGLRMIAVVGIVSIPLYNVILKKLVAIIETVRAGDPFVAVNAQRLQSMAWAMLALQMLGMGVGAISDAISSPAHPIDVDGSSSIGGWLAVLLTFVLARVFAHGTAMRDELEGTV
jgi:hypothetical protein